MESDGQPLTGCPLILHADRVQGASGKSLNRRVWLQRLNALQCCVVSIRIVMLIAERQRQGARGTVEHWAEANATGERERPGILQGS